MDATAETIRQCSDRPPSGAEAKPQVVMLHGMFGGSADWDKVAGQLADEWPVHILAMPVFETPRGVCGLENLLSFLIDWLDRRGIERAVLVGNSLGGHIALLAALRYPERVIELVLTGSAGLLERGFDRKVPRRPGRDWVRSRVAEVFFDQAHVTDQLLDEVSAIIGNPRLALNIVRMARAARRSNLRDDLPRITCPVTLIWGCQDEITPPEVAHEFARHLPDAELHFIDNCGHAPPIEKPAEFHRILRATLDQLVA